MPCATTSPLTIKRERFLYCRVSSPGQKKDLESQISALQPAFPDHVLIRDIGSGLNFKRKGLKRLLERVMSGTVEEIVVTHKDRLCRFGFDLIESMVNTFGGRILVQNHAVRTPEEELTQDLLTIIHVFSCRLYGLRRYSRTLKSIVESVGTNGTESGTETTTKKESKTAEAESFCGHHAKKTKVDKDEKVEENVSCRRYRLRPHRTQVQLLRQWFGVAREYYNATIDYLVKEKAKACFQDIRPIIKDKLDNAKL
ncbi:hypothetical protein HK102_008119, partial [Quaeritorhiza haematococci]